MFKIKTMNKISKLGLDGFDKNLFAVSDAVEDPDAILVRSASLHDIEFTPSLKAIGRAGAGVNNIPVELCIQKNIVVFNTPGANANAVKEMVLGCLFMASRNILPGMDYVKSLSGNDHDIHELVEANKSLFKGMEIRGKKLGVIGLGSVGLMVANDAAALGMDVEGYDPFISVSRAWELSRAVKPAASLSKMLASCDFITLHMSLTVDTRGLINAEALKKMKKDAVLLNFARAEIVDEEAIIQSLNNKEIGLYVTDFPTEALLKVPQVYAIPHLGASTREAEDNCAIMIAEQMSDFLMNGNISNSVNFPSCSIERTGDARLVIVNKNIPNMVGQITSILASANLNILEMVNKSRAEIAYTIVDIQGDCPESLLPQIKEIHGIMSVRLLV